MARTSGKRRVETALESILTGHLRKSLVEVTDRGQDNFRSERKRSNHGPWSQGAVIRSVRNTAVYVVIELTLLACDLFNGWSRTIARSETPNEFAIAFEASGVFNSVLLLSVSGATAVFEIIDPSLPHVVVLNGAKIDPHVRELMDEERTSVDEVVSIKTPPFISLRPGLVAFFW